MRRHGRQWQPQGLELGAGQPRQHVHRRRHGCRRTRRRGMPAGDHRDKEHHHPQHHDHNGRNGRLQHQPEQQRRRRVQCVRVRRNLAARLAIHRSHGTDLQLQPGAACSGRLRRCRGRNHHCVSAGCVAGQQRDPGQLRNLRDAARCSQRPRRHPHHGQQHRDFRQFLPAAKRQHHRQFCCHHPQHGYRGRVPQPGRRDFPRPHAHNNSGTHGQSRSQRQCQPDRRRL
ncbi:hypothetical protein D9M73_44690 [compost metagenome]